MREVAAHRASAASDLRIMDNTSTGIFVPYLRVDCPFPLDGYTLPAAEALRADVLRAGEGHPFLSYGPFGSDLQRFEAALDHTTEEVLRRARILDEGWLPLPAGPRVCRAAFTTRAMQMQRQTIAHFLVPSTPREG
jgi:hypothetical protein